MQRIHAIGTALVGVTLSASAALAAAPLAPTGAPSTIPTSHSAADDTGKPDDNHGAVVSAVARDHSQVGGEHDNHGGAVSAAAHAAEPDAAPEAPDADAPDGDSGKPTDNHGAAVSTVAKDKTQVGGKHNNHGGAVSAAAHAGKEPKGHAPDHPHGHD